MSIHVEDLAADEEAIRLNVRAIMSQLNRRHRLEWLEFFQARGMDVTTDPECGAIMLLASRHKLEAIKTAAEVLP